LCRSFLSVPEWILVEFGVLGPLQVNGGDAALPAKQRILLAVLLLHANRVVPVDALIDAVWDHAPPPSARTTLQGHVKQLRQNRVARVGERMLTRSPGYLITVAAGELDLDRFTGLCDGARSAAAAGDWAAAAAGFGKALMLWRGDPLADVPSATVHQAEVPRLAELRMRAVESRVEAELRLGRHGELVPELRRLAGGEPLREGLHGQLMLALYRCGRQAEALEVFRSIDGRLRGELGIAAGPELQDLHQRILATDPSLTVGPELAVAARPGHTGALSAAAPVPGPGLVLAQLPPDTVDFTGREEQVKLLCDLVGAPQDPGRRGAVVISAVAGMAGIGKTALAVHVAHRLRDRFPDGQLYVSLGGATSPLQPGPVLTRLLHDLGDLDTAIPARDADRATRYRSLLADRKMLIVLDDAHDAAQVRPLLPGSAGCAVIVTARGGLTGLAGATQLNLDVLDANEARDLFAAIIGAERADAEPEATAAVLACCAGLPLAVRIAASRLASRPSWSIAHLAAKLAGERNRLAELTAGDLAVRASFAVSYDALATAPGSNDSADPARVFRLLGLPEDMPELSLPAIAALAGQPPTEVATALETLTDGHLLESPAPDRYRLHDLLRRYAAELADSTDGTDGTEQRAAALSRMLTWYGEQAVIAARMLAPTTEFPEVIPVPAVSPTTMIDAAGALEWYEAELANLNAAVRQAAACGLPGIAAQIPLAMRHFFQRTAYEEVRVAMSEIGVRSARHLGDDAALAAALIVLASGYSFTGRPADAEGCFTEGLEIRRRTGDRMGEAVALNAMALNLYNQGRLEEAVDCQRASLAVLADLGEQRSSSAGIALNNIADMLGCLNRHDEALACAEQALAVFLQIGDLFGVSTAETTLAQTYLALDRHEDAVRHCQQALIVEHDTAGENAGRADALCCLASAMTALGRPAEARDAWQAALPILDRLGDPRTAGVRDGLAGTPGSSSPPDLTS
jgi:DNA-binding SARP family transcriptional activator